MALVVKHVFGGYVTGLDNSLYESKTLEAAVLHTERVTDGAIGNKAFKLAAFLHQLQGGSVQSVMSFGGAWSNHLHALAYSCYRQRIACVGVVRESHYCDNVLINSAKRYGMRIHSLSRAEYRRRDDAEFCKQLCERLNCDAWLPEGGSTDSAVEACGSIAVLIEQSAFNPTHVVLPVATGATFAGIARALKGSVIVLGLPVVRDDKVLNNVQRWLNSENGMAWQLKRPITPAYGKVTDELLNFMLRVHAASGVVLDPVYTGKALMHCLSGEFTRQLPPHSRLLFVHTGGLMGCYGHAQRIAGLQDQQAARDYLQALEQLCEVHLS